MDFVTRARMIEEYIQQRNENFERIASRYDWDYMTDWSESSRREKYEIAAAAIDKEIEKTEINDFIMDLKDKMHWDALDTCIASGDICKKIKFFQEIYGETIFNKAMLETCDVVGLVILSGKEQLEQFSSCWLLEPEGQDKILDYAENNGNMSISIISIDGKTISAFIRLIDQNRLDTITINGGDISPASFVGDLFQNAILEESSSPSPK